MGYVKPDVLVETGWVAEHLGDPALRIVEVSVDRTAYDQGHIPGALNLDWKVDLTDPLRRDLPSQAQFEALLSEAGISNDHTVVFYGDNNNWFAAWAYWIFQYYGHRAARIMNGGRRKWIDEGRPLVQDVPSYPQTQYRAAAPNPEIRALRDYVLARLGQPGHGLVDVRSPREYTGELLAPENLPQEGAQRGGHIPGAKNIPWGMAVREDGTFKTADELRALYEGQGITPDKEVIAYCRIGERSAHTWFVLRELLGYPRVRNYDGSWTEYGSLVNVPIEK
ncbi:MAG: sulfurtransferase [Armatimonadota bacterium]|nr:sulfurtransferase [Armatimonadota bacterium]